MNAKKREESLTLEILEAIEDQSDVTQRNLAKRMDVALGLANSYLKRCVRKGWVKIHQAPANRYLYYLTPTGFAEKSRLTAQYLSYSFSFYRKASDSCARVMAECEANQRHRVLLCGVSDLAEIASLRAMERQIAIVAVYDAQASVNRFLDREVVKSLHAVSAFDACVVTDLLDPHSMVAVLREAVDDDQIVVPDILGVKTD